MCFFSPRLRSFNRNSPPSNYRQIYGGFPRSVSGKQFGKFQYFSSRSRRPIIKQRISVTPNTACFSTRTRSNRWFCFVSTRRVTECDDSTAVLIIRAMSATIRPYRRSSYIDRRVCALRVYYVFSARTRLFGNRVPPFSVSGRSDSYGPRWQGKPYSA